MVWADRRVSKPSSPSDIIDLMDAFGIKTATIAPYDWGARTADVIAALRPERCKALVSVSGYVIGSQEASKTPLPPKAELEWWCRYCLATGGATISSAVPDRASPIFGVTIPDGYRQCKLIAPAEEAAPLNKACPVLETVRAH